MPYSYRPSMHEADGTMFSMEFYCQNHAKLSPKLIKVFYSMIFNVVLATLNVGKKCNNAS